jgi:hypothetical protein
MGASFFSTSFGQPLGSLIEPDAVRGYYVDLRVKAREPGEPEVHPLHVVSTQWGLSAHEHWLHTEREEWLASAVRAGEHVLREMGEDGALVHREPYPHSYRLEPPWLSAMAQGQAASLLVRLHAATGDERMAEGALRVLRPMSVPSSEGGVQAELHGGPFLEEYPTQPGSYVLNGGIFALWGLRDATVALGDSGAGALFEAGLNTLAANLHRWDTGWWSRYDLFPHPVLNVASPAYHELHMDQLRAMQLVAPRPEVAERLERFSAYARSPLRRARAFALKVAFRLRVPRGRQVT